MLPPLKYRFPDGYDIGRLIRELADRYPVRTERSRSETISFYDTFDWRLYHRSLVLYTAGSRLFLRKLFGAAPIHHAEVTAPPVFLRDIPEGVLKKKLAPIVDVRALRKLAELHSRSTPYRIANHEGKTVARILHEENRVLPDTDAPLLAETLWWKPARGNVGESRGVRKRLEEAGFTVHEKEDLFFAAMKESGEEPGGYSTKPDVALDPGMRSDEAVKTVLRFLLRVMRVNAENLEKDLDAEFLHDFRVALRRTRSALSQMKHVFPAETARRFRKELSSVGKISNPLRDLDVYLLNEDACKKMLPASLRDDIDPLFDYLRMKRSREFREVIRRGKSGMFRNLLREWDGFLQKPGTEDPTAPDAALPIRDVAQRRIRKQYERVLKEGNRVLDDPKGERLHLLRIECKELRYLLEFFSRLFSPRKIRGRIGQLKKLQDLLGSYNDLRVQERYLLDVARELRETGRQAEKTPLAIGSLVRTLNREKQALQGAFAKTFAEFASPANRKSFRDLFPTASEPFKKGAS
jgi:CHAD domain-containing protein